MSSLSPMLENWIPLIALLWLASIVLLVVSMRRYATSRSFFDARAARLFVHEPFLPAAAPDPVAETLADQSETDPGSAPVPSLHDAVRERVARDPATAHGLVELVRALYLDGSSFEFHAIAELDAEDRALAKALVDAWLADPVAVDDWKRLYDAVREARPLEQLRNSTDQHARQ